MSRRSNALAWLCVAAALACPAEVLAETVTVARALDKVTARVTELALPQDQPVRFGTLQIVARHCEKTPPTEPPETFAFVQIDDMRAEGDDQRVFSGWMFASSPSLSALEHPVYDVWVIDCRVSEPGQGEGSE
ncbi:MAG: DUF2155 domain-containing protein [Rhodothalassiaceae bacterium]